jgi:hypothetical protein
MARYDHLVALGWYGFFFKGGKWIPEDDYSTMRFWGMNSSLLMNISTK